MLNIFCWRIWKGGRRFVLFPSYALEPRGEEGSHLSKNSVRVAVPCTSQRARCGARNVIRHWLPGGARRSQRTSTDRRRNLH